MSSEYQRHGIKMMALCPDTVKTAFLENVKTDNLRYHEIINAAKSKVQRFDDWLRLAYNSILIPI